MKRVCSALLSAVLCLSMLSPALAAEGAKFHRIAADPAEFSDAKDIQYWDAAAALTQLGVINGKDDGAFHPADSVTRAEAAKMMAVIIDGKDTDYDLSNSEGTQYASFCANCSDAVGHWAERYIQLCWACGLLRGQEDGSCAPDENLTVMEFTKMVLGVLGRNLVDYELVGNEFVEEPTRLTLYNGLPEERIPHLLASSEEGVDPALLSRDNAGRTWQSAPLDRDSAAQILYNALQTKTQVMFGSWGDPAKDVGEYTSADWDGTGLTLIQAAFKLKGVESLTLPTQPGK